MQQPQNSVATVTALHMLLMSHDGRACTLPLLLLPLLLPLLPLLMVRLLLLLQTPGSIVITKDYVDFVEVGRGCAWQGSGDGAARV